MKKIIYMLIGLLLIVPAIAISVGSYYTQDNIDAIDVTNFDLKEGFVRDGNNKIVTTCENRICKVQVSMVSVDKNMSINETDNSTYWDGDTYVVVDRVRDIRFLKQPWVDLRDETDVTNARQELAKWLKTKRSRLVAEERRYLESIQTEQNIDLSDVLADLE